jgi:hypothetical protein
LASSPNVSDIASAVDMPAWLSRSSGELRAIKGPPGWIELVNGLCILDAALGYPSGKVCTPLSDKLKIHNASAC